MRKLLPLIFAAALIVFCSIPVVISEAQSSESPSISPNLVISQFQAGGGTADDEFIEIHNAGPLPVDLNGHRLVYRSATGTNDVGPMAVWTTSTVLQPGQFYLVASTSYDGGVTPDAAYNPSMCMCSMGANGGGLAIRRGGQNTGIILDSVGWGTATNAFVEGTATSAPGNNNSKSRNQSGCQDTDNSQSDFTTTIPGAARNSSSPASVCSGGGIGSSLLAGFGAEPTAVSPGNTVLFQMTVLPATNPPSTGIAVSGNLSQIGGASSQTFFDDGTNGDTTAGDNIYSFLAVVPGGISGGYFDVTATAADAQSRAVSKTVNISVNVPVAGHDPLIFGNPSGATANIANENNYLMLKPTYSLSYNRSKATPNWVAWHLDSSWIGSTPRQDDYRPDPSLPVGWYQVLDNDYSGSGYDRGHMCPSGDRTSSVPVNSSTFLMTNFVPQLSANNQGPWEDLESYCRSVAAQGNELYIVTGPLGTIGTIAQGRIVVPQYTWKVVLVLPNGDNDVQRVTRATRVFGIVVPNFPPVDINAPWRNFRVTVDAVENLTGYDFFSAIPINTQALIERKRDTQ